MFWDTKIIKIYFALRRSLFSRCYYFVLVFVFWCGIKIYGQMYHYSVIKPIIDISSNYSDVLKRDSTTLGVSLGWFQRREDFKLCLEK